VANKLRGAAVCYNLADDWNDKITGFKIRVLRLLSSSRLQKGKISFHRRVESSLEITPIRQ